MGPASDRGSPAGRPGRGGYGCVEHVGDVERVVKREERVAVSVRTPTRRFRRLVVPLVLGVTASLLLSGCGRTGLAASVNGRDITVDHVQSAVASLRAADKAAFGGVTDAQVLAVLLYGPY